MRHDPMSGVWSYAHVCSTIPYAHACHVLKPRAWPAVSDVLALRWFLPRSTPASVPHLPIAACYRRYRTLRSSRRSVILLFLLLTSLPDFFFFLLTHNHHHSSLPLLLPSYAQPCTLLPTTDSTPSTLSQNLPRTHTPRNVSC